MYSAIDLSKYIIWRCNRARRSISNLKLQKILYFVQAEFLVANGIPCFYERIEAWDFGPVIPEVYHKYKIFGSATIPYSGEEPCYFNQEDKNLIDGIVNACADYSASELVEITHNQSPWREAYRPYSNAEITTESIKRFFEGD